MFLEVMEWWKLLSYPYAAPAPATAPALFNVLLLQLLLLLKISKCSKHRLLKTLSKSTSIDSKDILL